MFLFLSFNTGDAAVFIVRIKCIDGKFSTDRAFIGDRVCGHVDAIGFTVRGCKVDVEHRDSFFRYIIDVVSMMRTIIVIAINALFGGNSKSKRLLTTL